MCLFFPNIVKIVRAFQKKTKCYESHTRQFKGSEPDISSPFPVVSAPRCTLNRRDVGLVADLISQLRDTRTHTLHARWIRHSGLIVRLRFPISIYIKKQQPLCIACLGREALWAESMHAQLARHGCVLKVTSPTGKDRLRSRWSCCQDSRTIHVHTPLQFTLLVLILWFS
jgi:hypothetical protein